jgi:chemotaxis protein MotB
LAAGLTLLGGCVSAEKFNRAVAANDRAQAELKNTHQKLQAALEDNQQLLNELALRNKQLSDKDRIRANLERANADWEKKFKQLKDLYNSAEPISVPVATLPPQLDKALQDLAQRHGDLVEYDRVRGMVKFKSDLLFARGSDDVSAEAKTALGKFAAVVKGAEAAQFHIYIVGHTDDMRIGPETARRHPNNWYLSVHRAISVKDALSGAGVQGKRMGVMGFGEYHPVAPNAPGKRGNPLNRRVEIWILSPDRFLTVSTSG